MQFQRIAPLLLVTAAVLAAGAALPSTADAQGRLRGIGRLGGDFGGDKVLEFEYQDGSSPDVTAGGGLLFTLGGVLEAWRSGGHGLDAQVNVGLKYRTIPAACRRSWCAATSHSTCDTRHCSTRVSGSNGETVNASRFGAGMSVFFGRGR